MRFEGTYLSLKPSPPFEFTEMTASLKLHDEVASAMPAPMRSNEGSNERRNRIFFFFRSCGGGEVEKRELQNKLRTLSQMNTLPSGFLHVAMLAERWPPCPPFSDDMQDDHDC